MDEVKNINSRKCVCGNITITPGKPFCKEEYKELHRLKKGKVFGG